MNTAQQSGEWKQISINIDYTFTPAGATERIVTLFRPNSSMETALQTNGFANQFSPIIANLGQGVLVPPSLSAAWYNGGDLILSIDVATDLIKVSCKQSSYVQLQSFLKSNSLLLKKVRITGSTVFATERNFTVVSQDIFGDNSVEEIVVANFKTPTQIQPNILDVNLNKVINGDSGLNFSIVQGETINLDFTCKLA